MPSVPFARRRPGGGQAPTSFLMHARHRAPQPRGAELSRRHRGIVLASGRLGRKAAATRRITGQANGQGGREHGQVRSAPRLARHHQP